MNGEHGTGDEPLFDGDVGSEQFDALWCDGTPVMLVSGVDPASVKAPQGWLVLDGTSTSRGNSA